MNEIITCKRESVNKLRLYSAVDVFWIALFVFIFWKEYVVEYTAVEKIPDLDIIFVPAWSSNWDMRVLLMIKKQQWFIMHQVRVSTESTAICAWSLKCLSPPSMRVYGHIREDAVLPYGIFHTGYGIRHYPVHTLLSRMYGTITTLIPLYLVFQHFPIEMNRLSFRWSSSTHRTRTHPSLWFKTHGCEKKKKKNDRRH